ncbi:hypothetical protein GHT06_013056 [Daphnia sinensis]|uniref:Uncharacterized protein n=1 Tax=Daphnia sinensis TaxID=1820382 RepID=A0AAD5LG34_9CRUS|nr:hypothetical protein GHT06_013056 [Daphnia sinensis]
MEWTKSATKIVRMMLYAFCILLDAHLIPPVDAIENDTGDFEDVLREHYRGPVAFFTISVLLFIILMLSCCLYASKRSNLHNPDAIVVDFNY